MPARRAPLLATIVLAAAVGLTGCIQPPPAPQAEPSPETSAPETSATPSESDEAEETQPAAASGDVAAPGTEYGFGESATIELLNLDDQPQLVSITVAGTRPGSLADFEAAGLDQDFLDQLVGYEPLYVDIELTKLEPYTAEIAYESVYIDFSGVDATDNALQDISIFGEFEPCDSSSIEPETDTGAVHTTCIIVATRSGQEFGGVTYGPYDTAYDDYDGEPLVWRP